ncbi:MAG: ABC transporter permease [Alphaproteobacteria bacterium]|nr:ABC transporter permease [Alphaproteobacteria bacterium]
MIRLQTRGEASRVMALTAPLIAVTLTVVTGAILFEALGKPAGPTLHAYFIQPLSTRFGLSELLVKATPLVLIGIGLSIGFRANVWNIGAEGQLTLGAITGGALALAFYEVDSPLLLPGMLIAGTLGGMAWAAIPAYLRIRFNANEILVSLMLTYVAGLFLSYLVSGPLRDPDGFNFPESRLFHDAATLPTLMQGLRAHWGAVIALFAVIAAWVFLSRTILGFQLKVLGDAPRAASFAGYREPRLVWFSLLLGGGLAGLAGVIEVSGAVGQLNPSISPGYGFTAIIVAFLGRLHPLGVLIGGLMMALTYIGGENAQIAIGLPVSVTGVFQGVLLFYVLACDLLIHYRIKIGRPVGVKA